MVIMKHVPVFVSAPLPPIVTIQAQAEVGQGLSARSHGGVSSAAETIQSIYTVLFSSLFLALSHIDHSSIQTWCSVSVNQILDCVLGVFLVTPLHENCLWQWLVCPSACAYLARLMISSVVTFCIWQITFTAVVE